MKVTAAKIDEMRKALTQLRGRLGRSIIEQIRGAK